MAERIEFELVSPEQLLVARPVQMVVFPAAEGLVGVLPGHIPMITTVKPGVIEVYDEDIIIDRIFVGGGFSDVNQKRLTVLVDEAVRVNRLKREELEQQIANLREDLEDARNDEERDAVEAKLDTAMAKLNAAIEFAAQKDPKEQSEIREQK